MNPTTISAHLSPLELFQQADLIVKSIIVLLILASLVSWGVIIDKLLRFKRLQRSAAGFTDRAGRPADLAPPGAAAARAAAGPVRPDLPGHRRRMAA